MARFRKHRKFRRIHKSRRFKKRTFRRGRINKKRFRSKVRKTQELKAIAINDITNLGLMFTYDNSFTTDHFDVIGKIIEKVTKGTSMS